MKSNNYKSHTNVKKRLILIFHRTLGTLTVFLCIFLISCNQNKASERTSDIFNYDYLPLDHQLEPDLSKWLKKARTSTENDGIYHKSIQPGYEYIYAKGYNQAKVRYTLQDHDGLRQNTLTTTLSEGEKTDEILLKIEVNEEVCCDGFVIDATSEW